MLGRLFLLFTLVPLVELYLLVTIGQWMGPGPTIALVAATGFVGAALARREGRKAIASYQEAMSKGQLPEDGIVSGLLILAGGVMLITPGVMTDIFGLSMMIPPIRRATAKLVKRRMQARIASGEVQVMHIGGGAFRAGAAPRADPRAGAGFGASPSSVVDVEVVEDPAANAELDVR